MLVNKILLIKNGVSVSTFLFIQIKNVLVLLIFYVEITNCGIGKFRISLLWIDIFNSWVRVLQFDFLDKKCPTLSPKLRACK